ncbi:ArnT family glycosyltransferase [Labilibacter marinus]|uniref:ArnT family glycosyltransferase n=1 Tax=Labilibacter marinus TaxID=1477105 RepID=UPI0009500B87|nr:glycosyltransferase family 39 protein [Labilibacter marinus]
MAGIIYQLKSKSFKEHLANPSGVFAFLIFFIVTFLIRFPFFFRDFIDHDESTFIIMGQSLIDGNLPYTELWDLKPPFVFYYFGAIIQLFGKSLIAIRFSGVVLVFLTAWFVYLIGKKIKSERFGFYNGLLYVVFASLLGTMQGVMSEHIAMLFCVWSIYLFIKDRDSAKGLLLTGLLAGTAMMFRLNLAYPYFILFAFYLLTSRLSVKQIFGNGLLLLLGVLVAPAFSFLPYWFNGIGDVWWNSVVIGSLSYSNVPWSKVLEASNSMIPCAVIIVSTYVFKNKINFFKAKDKNVLLLSIFTLGVLFMLMKGGKVNGHYLLQLYPFMWFFILELGSLINFSKIRKAGFLLWILVLLPAEAYIEYYKMGESIAKRGTLYHGETFEVVDYIQKDEPELENAFFAYFHIGYWLMDIQPPTKIATHPSNLLRPYLYDIVKGTHGSPMAEMKYLLEEVQPTFVVNKYERLPFGGRKSAENLYYQQYMKDHYVLVKEIGRAKILKRDK